jgi:FlaA1/EpsC-like NDP-sugar epimerase
MFLYLPRFIRNHIIDRPVSMFASDLAVHDTALREQIAGKSVLVIGGAGTIGSSFVKALLPYGPGALTVVDYSENGLTELTRDLRSAYNEHVPADYVTYPFDFGGEIFAKLFRSRRFDIVACFAAHKHVRSEKDHLAIEAMIRNNVFNTHRLLELAREQAPAHLFSVSTDKAANPVNVMGASKQLMEKVLLAYADELPISTARFANVAFSNGSLLDGFVQRILKQQPLSAPNDVRRYFVSPEESGQLCLLACLLGHSGEIFFPKLDESQMLTFSTIAERFLAALGLRPDYCDSEDEARAKARQWQEGATHYPVYFFATDTSGEKPYEEFFTATDRVDLDRFAALGVIQTDERPDRQVIGAMLAELDQLFTRQDVDKASIVALLSRYLPDFDHLETGKSLDQKM